MVHRPGPRHWEPRLLGAVLYARTIGLRARGLRRHGLQAAGQPRVVERDRDFTAPAIAIRETRIL
ncbi:expressed unknown protein [Ectocarpus siliculosus]|uniref:Uncharacterized protein n=1 Tax=Ectocarpus siliculosus TaxID=2880 RepID=D8LIV4_ECTSI|nr:expressed unknown protein [Ectocarpus siliculosus]|eukprot:CBN76838.1 expressed unknown protein [Ectocarpus siliculosus]